MTEAEGDGPKFKRSNEPERKKARRLVGLWYADQVKEGGNRYSSDAQVLTALPDEHVPKEPGAVRQPWNKPLTARGTETRVVDRDGFEVPRGESADPFAKYGRHDQDDYMRYVRRCMAYVMAANLNAHKVLEMEAAGWNIHQIAGQIGLRSPTAVHSLISEGLMAVQMFQACEKPLKSTSEMELVIRAKDRKQGLLLMELELELEERDGLDLFLNS